VCGEFVRVRMISLWSGSPRILKVISVKMC